MLRRLATAGFGRFEQAAWLMAEVSVCLGANGVTWVSALLTRRLGQHHGTYLWSGEIGDEGRMATRIKLTADLGLAILICDHLGLLEMLHLHLLGLISSWGALGNSIVGHVLILRERIAGLRDRSGQSARLRLVRLSPCRSLFL